MKYSEVTLDPTDLDGSMLRLAEAYDLTPEGLSTLRRAVALLPRSTRIYMDDTNAPLVADLPLADKFTFDLETDDLVVFDRAADTLLDGLIEMAMYLSGFLTLMGTSDAWVIEFAIGAWKPVKKRIKRQLALPVQDHPRGIVGQLPSSGTALASGPYSFLTLVSHYDLASFHQMVLLAGRDDIVVRFPPETHPKVLAVYVYARRAMQEIAQGIDLTDFQTFNTRLISEIQRFEQLFGPQHLALPDWLDDLNARDAEQNEADHAGPFPPVGSAPPERKSTDSPFEAFIEQLLADDDSDQKSADDLGA